MAYQQQGGMGNGALGAAGDQHVPQGTEYTLQGMYCQCSSICGEVR